MSRRWLLSLLCLFVTLLLFVQLTGARGVLRVNEGATRIQFHGQQAEVSLPVENSSSEVFKATAHIEILDTRNQVSSSIERSEIIGRGRQTLTLSLPLDLSKLSQAERSRPVSRSTNNDDPIFTTMRRKSSGVRVIRAGVPSL